MELTVFSYSALAIFSCNEHNKREFHNKSTTQKKDLCSCNKGPRLPYSLHMVKVQIKEMHQYLHLLVHGLESLHMVKLHMQQFHHLLVPGLESLNMAKAWNKKMHLRHSTKICITHFPSEALSLYKY
jgi:hypothetical protein